jgi:hypothetical protein
MNLPKKQLRILVSLITVHCCLNKHLHRMELTTSPVFASCQLEEEISFHFVCVCPTFATLRTRVFGKPIMNVSEFTVASPSAIPRFAFQSGKLETNFWHNSLSSIYVLFVFVPMILLYLLFTFSPRRAHWAQTEARVQKFCFYQKWLHPF